MNAYKYQAAFILFGVICLITALYFSQSTGMLASQQLAGEGGRFGPIKTDNLNQVVQIQVSQTVPMQAWSTIAGEVVDARDNTLFSFNEELWSESGIDSDGPWTEKKNTYNLSITFTRPGEYFIEFDVESSLNQQQPISVQARRKRGSSIPYMVIGGLAIIIGLLISMFMHPAEESK